MSQKPSGISDESSRLVREMAGEIERHIPQPPDPTRQDAGGKTIGDLVAYELYDHTNAGWRDYGFDRVVKIVNDIVDRCRPDPQARPASAQ